MRLPVYTLGMVAGAYAGGYGILWPVLVTAVIVFALDMWRVRNDLRTEPWRPTRREPPA